MLGPRSARVHDGGAAGRQSQHNHLPADRLHQLLEDVRTSSGQAPAADSPSVSFGKALGFGSLETTAAAEAKIESPGGIGAPPFVALSTATQGDFVCLRTSDTPQPPQLLNGMGPGDARTEPVAGATADPCDKTVYDTSTARTTAPCSPTATPTAASSRTPGRRSASRSASTTRWDSSRRATTPPAPTPRRAPSGRRRWDQLHGAVPQHLLRGHGVQRRGSQVRPDQPRRRVVQRRRAPPAPGRRGPIHLYLRRPAHGQQHTVGVPPQGRRPLRRRCPGRMRVRRRVPDRRQLRLLGHHGPPPRRSGITRCRCPTTSTACPRRSGIRT